jgi:gamma-glutamylcysteine synthetase
MHRPKQRSQEAISVTTSRTGTGISHRPAERFHDAVIYMVRHVKYVKDELEQTNEAIVKRLEDARMEQGFAS